MAWLRAADTEIKRDMEISRDEVRVMTVHGAKGLEAPVVFLIDTTSSPADTQRLNSFICPEGVVVWAGKKADDPSPWRGARAAQIADTEDEYRRLLYVDDDTRRRSADRWRLPARQHEECAPALSWYDLIAKGLANSGLQLQESIEEARGAVKRYARPEGVRKSAQAQPSARRPKPRSNCLRGYLAPAPREARGRKRAASVRPHRECKPQHQHREPASPRSCVPARFCGERWCIGCCSRCPIGGRATPRRGAKYLARNADGWTGDECKALAEKRAGADRGSALCGGICRRLPRRGLDCRTAGSAGGRPGWCPGKSIAGGDRMKC